MKLSKLIIQGFIAPVLVGIGEKIGETFGEMISEHINPTPWRCNDCGEHGVGGAHEHVCPDEPDETDETEAEDESVTA